MKKILPSDFGLPHDTWRTGQLPTIQKVLGMGESETMIIHAATGSGKTSFAAAVGHEKRVIALSHTKTLQKENYAGTYNFEFLFGKGNYECALHSGTSAQFCEHKTSPRKCPSYGACRYYIERKKVREADKAALNYAYFMTAKWPRLDAPARHLVLDEAHLLPDLVLEQSSITITEEDRRKYELPPFPVISSKSVSMLYKFDPIADAKKWLIAARAKLRAHTAQLELRARGDRKLQKEYSKAESLLFRMTGTLDGLKTTPDDWFIRSGPTARELRFKKRAPGFVCKPLTARHHFKGKFLLGGPTVLMSATIGDFGTLAEELGIEKYTSVRVPSVWQPATRPVYYFEDAPTIGRKTTESGWDEQADLIKKMLHSVPRSWSGVIHTTSKKQARDLAGRLANNGLSERIWIPPITSSTDRQLELWEREKARTRGALAIAWGWWVGMDLTEEKICICAKTPFPFIGSDYTRARMRYSGKMYRQRAAWQLQQGCGRTRRGRPQDYDIGGVKRGLVAVVDGAWKQIRKYMDTDFLESMTAF